MDYLSFSGNHYAMGKALGNFFIENNAIFPLKLNDRQKSFGRESGKILEQLFPEVSKEIKGVTDTIKINNELFTSLLICAGCCLTIRENHNVEVRGCTAFSFIKNNKIYYGRDNDLPPYLKNVSKSIYYEPENRNKFILNTSSFVNGEEGINEHGLVAAMTFVKPVKGEITPGLNSLFLVRLILENCSSVEEALSFLEKVPIASSCNILLADKNMKMLVAECNPLKLNIRYPEKSDRGEDFIVTVNHFTSPEMSEHDASNKNIYSSRKRYETAHTMLQRSEKIGTLGFIRDLLSGRLGFMCQYKKTIKFETIWSSIFDISDKKVYLAGGNPSETEYVEDLRLKFNY